MSTDNAYVQADTVGVSTDVAGTVVAIEVHDNEAVRKGQVLYRLKPDSFQIALDGAKAQLGTVHDQVVTPAGELSARAGADRSGRGRSSLLSDRVQAAAGSRRDRRRHEGGAHDQAQHDLETAKQKLDVAKAQADTALAQLGGDPDQPIEQNPFYLQAKSGVDNAQRDLNDTIVRAPFDGVVTNVNAIQVGSYLQASQQAFSLVSTTAVWVEASPKETELTYVRPGQPATISVDAYPGRGMEGRRRQHQPGVRLELLAACRPRTRPAIGSRSSSASPCASISTCPRTRRRCASA